MKLTQNPILSAKGVVLRFGGLVALGGVDLDIKPGIVQAVIGPNGSGKTTLLNTLSGAYKPDAGSITLDDVELVGLKPFKIARLGLARTFQNIRLFAGLTVLENVMVSAARYAPTSLYSIIGATRRQQRSEIAITEGARLALETVSLAHRATDMATLLPYAQQRLLEIARALAAKPKVLLLDEPAAGMNATEAQQLLAIISKLRATGLTILLVEHNVRLVMGISDRISVLDFGKKIAEGSPSEIQKDAAVIEAYLGRRRHVA